METYIILGSWTKQGIDTIKDIESRVANSRAAIEQAGGQWVGFWMTMGQYDFVLVTTSPDGPTAATLLLATAMDGNVRTETLRAFSEDEMARIVANIP
jgi:uncharacterized protein with GYD domain